MKRVLSLPQRRLAVVVQLLSYPLILIPGVYKLSFLTPLLSGLLSLLAVLLWVGSSGFLFYNTSIWQFGNAPDAQLDERQNIVRNYAYRNAYILLSTLILFALLYGMLAIDFHWWLPSRSGQFSAFFFSFLFLMLNLPSAIIAWTERDV